MSQPLPRLRMNLDFMPSPVEDRPGLLIRDSFRYSDAILIIPPALIEALTCFDGEHTDLDLRERLTRATGQLEVSEISEHLSQALRQSGFLEDESFEQMRENKQREFAEGPVRQPAHAGSAYPDGETELQTVMQRYLGSPSDGSGSATLAIAAPHVSPEGGWESYRAAYCSLGQEARDRTFVVVGTSHYGQSNRFGLTRKPFATPFGTTQVARDLVEELASEPAVIMEDYCHAVEHSIEFQIVFLQSLFGANIRVLPILCGSFARSLQEGGLPEKDPNVSRFFDALSEVQAREGEKLLWVLGVDMAHMGQRYGDRFAATANREEMVEVAERDHRRIAAINAGEPEAFWEQVRPKGDDLKWCGSAPLYTFLKAVPSARGTLKRYEQWNIDSASVVSFAGMSFERAS